MGSQATPEACKGMAALSCCPLVPHTPTRKLGLAPCLRGPTFPISPAAARRATFPPSCPACSAAATSLCLSIQATVTSREAWR